VLVRADSAGGTHDFLAWLTAPSRRLRYSVGMTITEDMQAAILKVPADRMAPAPRRSHLETALEPFGPWVLLTHSTNSISF
jgi:hypothetical protein